MLDAPHSGIYQLKVALRGISPLIWRRLLVHAETSIADLHHILQLVMGWTNSHLHRFLIHGKEYGIAYDGGTGFDDDPTRVRLRDFRFRLHERFLYGYDFSDNWQHDIRVEQLVTADTKRSYPVSIGGKRAAHRVEIKAQADRVRVPPQKAPFPSVPILADTLRESTSSGPNSASTIAPKGTETSSALAGFRVTPVMQ
jgi:hypothetical protein